MYVKPLQLLYWAAKITAAVIMLHTLFFKFSAAEESVYIFTTVGIEPWGRIGTGIAELIASILLLLPRTSVMGALLAAGIMAGAIASHLFILGIEIMNDGGQLFIYAAIVLLVSIWVIINERQKIFDFIQLQFAKPKMQ
jgi:hypothetical protein